MSLGPVYIGLEDGRHLKDPIIVFPEGFITFDEFGPENELVLRASACRPHKQLALAEAILHRLKIPFEKLRKDGGSLRPFPPKWKKNKEARSCKFELAGGMKLPMSILKHVQGDAEPVELKI